MTPDDTDSTVDSTNPPNDGDDSASPSMPRRGALALFALVGVGALTTQSTAAPPATTWQRDQDADGNELSNLQALTMAHNSAEITDFEGEGLDISDGKLTVDFDAVFDGSSLDIGQLLSAAGRYLEFDEGENELNFTGPAEWENGFEEAFNTASGGSSVVGGGRDNTANGGSSVVGGGRDNTASGSSSTVAGGDENSARGGNATVSGGENNFAIGNGSAMIGGEVNVAGGDLSVVGGGRVNEAEGVRSTIGGGLENYAGGKGAVVTGGTENEAAAEHVTIGGGRANETDDAYATIGGGERNEVVNDHGTVSGGRNNVACHLAAVGGGRGNTANGRAATIPGGRNNRAAGTDSLAAGTQAQAKHDGAFVVGNSTDETVESANADEVRFQGGGGFVVEDLDAGDGAPLTYDPGTGELLVDHSSARYKHNVEPLEPDPGAVLELEPRSFSYNESEREGVGLVAEEVAEHVPELVVTDSEGRPDAVRYDRLGVYLISELCRQREETAELRDRLETLEERVGTTAAANTAEPDNQH